MGDTITVEITSKGLGISSGEQEVWNVFSDRYLDGCGHQDFYKNMTRDLPEETNVRLHINNRGELTRLYILYSEGSDKRFSFNRSFKGKKVSHISADVVGMQDRGVSKIANRNLFNFYLQCGLEKASIKVGDIGVYAWGRVGFVPNSNGWNNIKYLVEKRLDFLEANPSVEDGPLPNSLVEPIRKVLSSPDAKNYWFIVDQEYSYHGLSLGKLLTLPIDKLPEKILDIYDFDGDFNDDCYEVNEFENPDYDTFEGSFQERADWSGSFDLSSSSDSMKRFNAYIEASGLEPVRGPVNKKAPVLPKVASFGG